MGCFLGLPLSIEGPGPALGANEGLDTSTSEEGGVDEATSLLSHI